MPVTWIILAAIVLLSVSGGPACLLSQRLGVLASGCVCLGLFPSLAAAPLESATRAWAAAPATAATSIAVLVPLGRISAMGLVMIAALAPLGWIATIALRSRAVAAASWDCGYAWPTIRMQYIGSSFGSTLVDLFGALPWPRTHTLAIYGLFPPAASFKSVVADTVFDRLVLASLRLAGRYLPILRVFQQAQMQSCVLYVLTILIVQLVWGATGVQS